MTYGELSASQARRSMQFAEAQTNAMSVYCDAERDLKELYAENVKLRELVLYMHRCYVMGHDWGPYGAPEKQHVEDTMRKLGIEVKR